MASCNGVQGKIFRSFSARFPRSVFILCNDSSVKTFGGPTVGSLVGFNDLIPEDKRAMVGFCNTVETVTLQCIWSLTSFENGIALIESRPKAKRELCRLILSTEIPTTSANN